MIASVLIAIVAGLTSALMFASIVSGALISLVLFNLAPLPLIVVGLGWGPLSGAIGGVSAAVVLGAIFGIPYLIAFGLTIALPAWWLAHLVVLGRPIHAPASSGNGASAIAPDLEWYPVGRILLWVAGFAALITMASLLTFGSDAASITEKLRKGLLWFISLRYRATVSEAWADALVTIAVAFAAMAGMTSLTVNLWLAAKIAATSGRLRRPWPDLKSVALPPMTLAALCVAIAFSFTGGLLAIVAQVVTATLMMAFTLTGFAVLHTLTLSLQKRALWLGATYAIVALFVWPALAMVALGIADAIFGFRQRYWQTRPPPLPVS